MARLTPWWSLVVLAGVGYGPAARAQPHDISAFWGDGGTAADADAGADEEIWVPSMENAPSSQIEEIEEGPDITTVSLEELLSQPVEVASRQAEKLREAPSVLTVLTREELTALGARDLSDALAFVPGFTQALDVQNTVGLGVRGIWAHEGKVLMLVDGVDMTDLLYGANAFGMHYLVSNIERIEIIRGPGSAVYGGNAGMAVINVITKNADSLEGGEVHARYGQMHTVFSDRSLGLNVGHTFQVGGSKLGASVTGYLGQGNRSEGQFRTFTGDEYAELGQFNNSSTDPAFVNAALSWRGLSARFIYDGYSQGSIDGVGDIMHRTLPDGTVEQHAGRILFETLAADLRGAFAPADNWSIEPRIFFRRQRPWVDTDPTSGSYYDKAAQRLGASVAASYRVLPNLQVTAGLEGTWDVGFAYHPERVGTGLHTDFSALNPADPSQANIGNGVAYLQARWDTAIANFTVGGRAEYHSAVGPSFVPRIAVTKSLDKFTAKLLLSGAFRAPSLENLNLGENLRPERIWAGEVELGYQLTDWAYASVNAYSVDVTQLIAYSVDTASGVEAYRNEGQVGSRGVEAEVHLRGSHGFARLSYSQAEASSGTNVATFLLPDTRARLVAMPARKITAMGRVYLTHGISANPSFIIETERGGYLTGVDGVPMVGLLPTTAIVNFNLAWDGPNDGSWASGVSVSAGVNNLFNTQRPWVQAYNGGHAPLPSRGTDLFIRVSYALEVARPAPGATP